ncbi:hypothetical protein RSSM_04888 [Rhodopirellula sallentina SM41]|uniref:Uncharacterized protein n=1 Tax=Rhodopirellula sallentina SM41 TaxID=1263870 RepID=M5TWT7_9BACT|nr:hypothetical protein RSSM_04888 [Rhodopirellula sallentina SM41]
MSGLIASGSKKSPSAKVPTKRPKPGQLPLEEIVVFNGFSAP